MVLVYLAFCIWSLFGYPDNGGNEKKDTMLYVCLFVFVCVLCCVGLGGVKFV